MIVTPIHTRKIVVGDNIEDILEGALPKLSEKTVVVITSKIVAVTEGRVAPLTESKEKLIRQEADRIFVNEEITKEWQMLLTMKNNVIVPWAGIDESNGNDMYVLWPQDPMSSAERIWKFLREKLGLTHLGVIIADSTFLPLRTGSVSIGIGWCGFVPVKSLIGQEDVFGKKLQYTNKGFVDSLAMAAGLTMGEANEQQPLAVITDIPDIEFVNRTPTAEEINSMQYPLKKDTFGPLIEAIKWEKGSK